MLRHACLVHIHMNDWLVACGFAVTKSNCDNLRQASSATENQELKKPVNILASLIYKVIDILILIL